MGKIYDIFFTADVPYSLPIRMGKDPTDSVLTVLDLNLHIGNVGAGLWDARLAIIRLGDELYGLDSMDSVTHMYELKDRCGSVFSAKAGEDILRIWREECARDLCGTMFVLSNLYDRNISVIDMKLSPGLRFRDLKDKGDDDIYRAFISSGIMGDDQRALLAARWDSLVSENAPVRILMDGEITGREEDSFDTIIPGLIPRDGCLMSELIEKIESHPSVEDMGRTFWVQRIRHLITDGKLTKLSDEPSEAYPYDCMIRI